MKNLIVCCDGTWNTPEDMDGGVPVPTNVFKIHNAVTGRDANGADQAKYYHSGVGTEGGAVSRALGGGVGLGLNKNIKSAYKWLAVAYIAGDRIFLFGFSRGAYTVRSLAGLIASSGLLDVSKDDPPVDEIWQRVDTVFENYSLPEDQRKPLKKIKFHHAKKGASGAGKTKIHFLGVWDTVGALGIPDDMALLNLIDDPSKHAFHDTKLNASVSFARHAVAIDERRQSFAPTLWTQHSNKTNIKQVWFPGVHSDVGGGYPETGLSDVALGWMIDEAQAQGLAFRQGAINQIRPDVHGVLHNSVTGVFKVLKTRPRSVPCFVSSSAAGVLHSSAEERHSNPPITQLDYWPSQDLGPNDQVELDIFAAEKWNATGIFLKKGEQYQLSAHGQWMDGSIKSGPAGTDDGVFQLGEIAQLAASGLGGLERLFKTVSGNTNADFWFTKREEQKPWFALVGVVANAQGTQDDGSPGPHENFLIGEGCKFSPKKDGYLYCFANDAWQTYDNNNGSVRLTIRRTK